ncbi:hypothetical protein [Maribacter sp. 2210JD10-5]|uniref:hypothetical protein n=1 Tax=Maribacter sp. 2210JD10-5 TaxID=3386272 RepID=UPI0039BC5670
MILVFRHFFYKNYVGLSLWPFIFLKDDTLKSDATLINHEKIHLRQQLELLVIPFYFLYVLEWLLKTIWYLDSYKAYQNLSFEREAYANEQNEQYLQKRKAFSFMKYLWLGKKA